jgi:hypothetical protein
MEHKLTTAELRKLRALKTPAGIQRYLDSLPYHLASTAWSPTRVLREGTAHCLEGAIFAAAALRAIGYPPLIFDMEAEQDVDHVMAIYKVGGHWGAIAKSNWTGCRGRDPVYRSLRELAMSYFHTYINRGRRRTLRTFSRPVNLKRFDRRNWMAAPDIWFIAEYLCDIPHTRILKPGMKKRLTHADERLLKAELTGHRWK